VLCVRPSAQMRLKFLGGYIGPRLSKIRRTRLLPGGAPAKIYHLTRGPAPAVCSQNPVDAAAGPQSVHAEAAIHLLSAEKDVNSQIDFVITFIISIYQMFIRWSPHGRWRRKVCQLLTFLLWLMA